MLDRLQSFIGSISPFYFAYTGIFTALGLSILGAGIGIYMVGTSLTQATVHHPEVKSKNLMSILFCEAIALYGIIMAIISFTLIPANPYQIRYANTGFGGPQNVNATYLQTDVLQYTAGYGIGFGGYTVGFVGLFSAVCTGALGSALVIAHANSPSIFVKIFISEVYAGAIALIGLICGIVMGLGTSVQKEIS